MLTYQNIRKKNIKNLIELKISSSWRKSAAGSVILMEESQTNSKLKAPINERNMILKEESQTKS